MKENKKLYIACICFIILIVSSCITKTMQNDTFFTIATGNYILENGYDNLDHLSWHENLNFYKLRWGFDVIIALIYNSFNFTGIYIFVLIIASITGIALFNILLKQNCKIIVSFIITISAMLFTNDVWGFTARAQIISYLLLLLEVFCIEKLIESKKAIYYIYLFIISVLLVNFHASVWMMTLILMGPYFVEALLSKFKITSNDSSRIVIKKIDIKSLLIAAGVMILGSFFSPIGTYTYTYMFQVIGGISSKFIVELQPTNVFENVGILIILSLFIILSLETKTSIRLSSLIMLLGLTFMAIIAKRNIVFLYIIGSTIIAQMLTLFFDKYDREKLLDKLSVMLQKNNIFVIIVLIVLIFSTANYLDKINEPYIDEFSYPVGAVNYVKKYIDYQNLKVFNHFNFGSYMEFCEISAFIDSRSEIYCEEFNDTEILQDWYETVYLASRHYKYLFEKYEIDYAILYNEELINTYMSEDENYIKLYNDNYFSVYIKRELYENQYSNIPLSI